MYGGTVRLLGQVLSSFGVRADFVDTSDEEILARALREPARFVFIETPANPTLKLTDIAMAARLAHGAGALLVVDNTLLSPCFQQPLALGADIVIHSATKFLCGHSDVTAGAVITNDVALHRQIAFQQNAEGAGLSPFESWLLLRGIKTLALRVERQNTSARKVAEFLARHDAVDRVYYPGFADHPDHEIHQRQASGDGAVLSFTTGDAQLSERLVESTRLFNFAVSFGSVGSAISLPYRMSHASIHQALKERLAPPADLVRISVGIEDVDDLIDDLSQAFTAAVAESRAKSASVACGR